MNDIPNFNIVYNCGDKKRTVYRYGDTVYIGCFISTYDEAITAITKKYTDTVARDAYIAKIDELMGTIDTSTFDVTSDGGIAIEWASKHGHLDVVQYLVEHGADVSARDNHAVKYASKHGHLDVVQYLVEHGADVTAK